MPLGHLEQLPAPLCCGQGIALQPYPAFRHGARKVSKLSTSANLHIPLSFFRDEYFLKTAKLRKASLNKESAKDTTVKAEYST
jgi:hypothetical protein